MAERSRERGEHGVILREAIVFDLFAVLFAARILQFRRIDDGEIGDDIFSRAHIAAVALSGMIDLGALYRALERITVFDGKPGVGRKFDVLADHKGHAFALVALEHELLYIHELSAGGSVADTLFAHFFAYGVSFARRVIARHAVRQVRGVERRLYALRAGSHERGSVLAAYRISVAFVITHLHFDVEISAVDVAGRLQMRAFALALFRLFMENAVEIVSEDVSLAFARQFAAIIVSVVRAIDDPALFLVLFQPDLDGDVGEGVGRRRVDGRENDLKQIDVFKRLFVKAYLHAIDHTVGFGDRICFRRCRIGRGRGDVHSAAFGHALRRHGRGRHIHDDELTLRRRLFGVHRIHAPGGEIDFSVAHGAHGEQILPRLFDVEIAQAAARRGGGTGIRIVRLFGKSRLVDLFEHVESALALAYLPSLDEQLFGVAHLAPFDPLRRRARHDKAADIRLVERFAYRHLRRRPAGIEIAAPLARVGAHAHRVDVGIGVVSLGRFVARGIFFRVSFEEVAQKPGRKLAEHGRSAHDVDRVIGGAFDGVKGNSDPEAFARLRKFRPDVLRVVELYAALIAVFGDVAVLIKRIAAHVEFAAVGKRLNAHRVSPAAAYLRQRLRGRDRLAVLVLARGNARRHHLLALFVHDHDVIGIGVLDGAPAERDRRLVKGETRGRFELARVVAGSEYSHKGQRESEYQNQCQNTFLSHHSSHKNCMRRGACYYDSKKRAPFQLYCR